MVVTGVGGSGQASNGVKVQSTLSSSGKLFVFSAPACQIKVYCGKFIYYIYISYMPIYYKKRKKVEEKNIVGNELTNPSSVNHLFEASNLFYTHCAHIVLHYYIFFL